jgi:hypothetical protein
MSAPEALLGSIIESAQRMGVELDRDEALRWMEAMATDAASDIAIDVDSGVYGHRVSMADHDDADLARIRRVARIAGLPDRPPNVTTALALSGSAAQGKIQRYPADCDFFERVHIVAPTRDAALAILADVLRDHALATLSGAGYRLWEAKWGTHDEPGSVRGHKVKAGSWISWTPAEVESGSQELVRDDGTVRRIDWAEAPGRPGWAKLDWLVGDRTRGILGNASNVIDPTWEAPDGTIVPLDGFLDPYFQEVYLEAESIPLFTRLVADIGADAVDDYVHQLEHEVRKYTVETPNHGKAARRMYNVFRLDGRYPEAAYLRELFDEPVTALYQLAALLQTVADAATAGADVFDRELLLRQMDQLIMSAIAALEGPDEALMVERLQRFRASVSRAAGGPPDEAAMTSGTTEMEVARAAALAEVDDYFRRALRAVPSIAAYLDEIAARPA